jgi:DNA-binding NarL/FixJ family response regulator
VPGTRLLLAAVPPLLADIVRDALAGEPGVDTVAEAPEDPRQLAETIVRTRADVVLAESHGAGLPDHLLELMYRHPRLKLLLLSPDGRLAALWRLAPERRELAETSPRALAEAVRAAVAG